MVANLPESDPRELQREQHRDVIIALLDRYEKGHRITKREAAERLGVSAPYYYKLGSKKAWPHYDLLLAMLRQGVCEWSALWPTSNFTEVDRLVGLVDSACDQLSDPDGDWNPDQCVLPELTQDELNELDRLASAPPEAVAPSYSAWAPVGASQSLHRHVPSSLPLAAARRPATVAYLYPREQLYRLAAALTGDYVLPAVGFVPQPPVSQDP